MEEEDEQQQQSVAPRIPKVCVTVSTVSSELDSLAFLPLHNKVAGEGGPSSLPSPSGLSNSLHLGEF